jgi:uncharacterized Zn finger protein (UPF0148 family)
MAKFKVGKRPLVCSNCGMTQMLPPGLTVCTICRTAPPEVYTARRKSYAEMVDKARSEAGLPQIKRKSPKKKHAANREAKGTDVSKLINSEQKAGVTQQKRRKGKKRRSVWTVSGGLPSLGKRR